MLPRPKTKAHIGAKNAATTRTIPLKKAGSRPTILLVDDDENMPLLIERALKTLKPRPRLHFVNNSFQGQDYLYGLDDFCDRVTYPLPDLLILDLKMPLVDGFQFIEWARAQPEFRHLPILALTNSVDPAHRTRALKLGANFFLVKPFDPFELIPQLKTLLGIP